VAAVVIGGVAAVVIGGVVGVIVRGIMNGVLTGGSVNGPSAVPAPAGNPGP